MTNQVEATLVTTGQVRLSYVHLFKPYAPKQGQEPKYSVTVLIPKSDMDTKQRIDVAIQAAISKGIAGPWNGACPPQPTTPVWDGDGLRKNGEPFGPECKGHWVLTAGNKKQQAVVDAALNPIINSTEIYSGMYGRVNISFFPFSNSGNRGVGASLGPVQKLAEGEPLGSHISVEQAFGVGFVPAPAPQGFNQIPPQQYAPPAQPQGFNPMPPQQYVPAAQPQGYVQQPQPQVNPVTGQPYGSVMGV